MLMSSGDRPSARPIAHDKIGQVYTRRRLCFAKHNSTMQGSVSVITKQFAASMFN